MSPCINSSAPQLLQDPQFQTESMRRVSVLVQMRPVGHTAAQATAQGWHLLNEAGDALLNLLGHLFTALWTHVAVPVQQAFAFVLKSLWRSVLQPIFDSAYAAGASTLAGLHDHIVQPIVQAVASALAACANAIAWVLLALLDVMKQYVVYPVMTVLGALLEVLFKYVFAPAALVLGFLSIVVLGVVLLLNQLGFNIKYGRSTTPPPRTAYPTNQW